MRGLLLVSCIALSTGCLGVINGPGSESLVTIDSSNEFQTIFGIGANIDTLGQKTVVPTGEFPLDAVQYYEVDHLNPPHLRVDMPLDLWEPTQGLFVTDGTMHDYFVYLKRLQDRGVSLTGVIFANPLWMSDANNHVVGGMLDALAECIVSWLQQARDVYGVTMDYMSENEAEDFNRGHYLSSADYATLIKKTGQSGEPLGLATKWLAGDTSTVQSWASYTLPILQDAGALKYIGAVSYHTWFGEGLPVDAAEYSDVADIAKQFGLPVFVEELGSGDGHDYLIRDTWNYAWKNALIYQKVLKGGRASVANYWSYNRETGPVSPALTPYPIFYVIKQLADHLTPGSVMIGSTSNDSNILVLAGKKLPTNHFMTQLINRAASAVTVRIAGLPLSTLTLERTSDSENLEPIASYDVSGDLVLTLPAESITLLTGRLSGR